MTAKRETIFAAIESALVAIALSPFVERMASGDPAAFPALIIVDGGQSASEEEAGATRYALEVKIEGFVEGATGAAAHGALNELHAQTVKALRAEPLLGGIVEELLEGDLIIDIAELAEARRLGFSQDFRVAFSTRAGDPAA